MTRVAPVLVMNETSSNTISRACGQVILRYRRATGRSVAAVAAGSMSVSVFSSYERGDRAMGLDQFVTTCALLGLDPVIVLKQALVDVECVTDPKSQTIADALQAVDLIRETLVTFAARARSSIRS
jgi:hypothetical protein